MAKKRLHLGVSGRVQGVFYRAETAKVAKSLGLTGWVRNLPDGRVEIVVEGDEEALQQFQRWCRQGPPAARVEEIEAREETWRGEFEDFSIRW